MVKLTDVLAPGDGPLRPATNPNFTLLCFSHLRWDFVFQRPQHLMTRFARGRRVVFWEEPEAALPDCAPALGVRICAESGVVVVTPSLPEGLAGDEREQVCASCSTASSPASKGRSSRWYYTPMMLPFSRHVEATATVYDCMDELANFRFAPPELLALEDELLGRADVVFTGGYSLYEAKRDRHRNIHPFPSSVDRDHFAQARAGRRRPGRPGGDRRGRGSASTASSTSAWTSTCSARSPTRGRTGRS